MIEWTQICFRIALLFLNSRAHAVSNEGLAGTCSKRCLLQVSSLSSSPSGLAGGKETTSHSLEPEHRGPAYFSALQRQARDRFVGADLGESMGDAVMGLSGSNAAYLESKALVRPSDDAASSLHLQLRLTMSPEDIQRSDTGPLPKFLTELHAALCAVANVKPDRLLFRRIHGAYLQLNTSADGSVETSDAPAGAAALLHSGVLVETRDAPAGDSLDSFGLNSESAQSTETSAVEFEVRRGRVPQEEKSCGVYKALLQQLDNRYSSLMSGSFGTSLKGAKLVDLGNRCKDLAASQQSWTQALLCNTILGSWFTRCQKMKEDVL